MDLYIQVGVILLFLAALSLFIYVYTTPAQKFTAKISENNQTIDDRLLTAEGMDVAIFKNNIDAKGSSIYPMIRDAKANKLAIFVQTKNSQGLVVNYGYQLRAANTNSVYMNPSGNSGSISVTSFEKSFVTTAPALFNSGKPAGKEVGTPVSHKFGSEAIGSTVLNNDTLKKAVEQGSALQYGGNTPFTPRLFFADPNVPKFDDAEKNGRTFGSTGLIYTDMVIKNDMPVNENFSYADNQNSVYRFNQNSGYYTTLIVNANNEVVGIYVEEHGVNATTNALAQMMLANGTITQLY